MRRLAWFCGGFGGACLLSCYVVSGSFPALFAGALGILFFLMGLLLRPDHRTRLAISLLPKPRRYVFQLCRRAAALCLGGALAFLWFAGYTALFYTPTEALTGTEQPITGTVTSYPDQTSIGGYSVTLRLDGDFRSPDLLLYGSEDWGALQPGDRVTCTARIKAADRLYGDETTYYTARGVFLLAYCDDPPTAERPEHIPLRYWPQLCAERLRAGIYAAFEGDAAALAAAVTLGDKTGLTDQLSSALNRSGIMHAAVVSGMHISFLVSVFLLLFRGRRGAALCLIPVLLFYALMAGGTPSAIRAVIMQAALLAGPLLRREADSPTALGLALLILLVQNPYAAASISLQLSFASVAGILLVSGRLAAAMMEPARRLRDKGKGPSMVLAAYRFVTSTVSVTLGALLFTTPLTVLYFGQIILVSPLTNLLTLWAITLLMVCALAVGTLAIFFPAAMALPGAFFGLLARYVYGVISVTGRWPLSSLDGTNVYFLIWLGAAYLMLLTILLARHKGRQTIFALVCLAALLGGGIWLNALSVRRADLTVTALDVGQGASTLLLSGERAVLVDCGGNSAADPGDLAADRLASMGRTSLDALVLTHLDDDHFNGVPQLFWRLDIERVFLPETTTEPEHLALLLELAEEEGAAVNFVTGTQTLLMGDTVLTLYPPLGSGTSNEEGLFALCSRGEFDALITGDADAFVEGMLVKYYPIPDLELLMVGHHGSAGSTSARLLDTLRPELAVISVGYNSYGHPAEAVLERLAAAGAVVYRTDLSGPVTVTLRDGRISIR